MMKKLLTTLSACALCVGFMMSSPTTMEAKAELIAPKRVEALDMAKEEIDKILREDGKIVKSKSADPKERIKSAGRLASTKSKAAFDKLRRAFKPGKAKSSADQRVSYAIGEAMASFTSDEVMVNMASEVKKLDDAEDIYLAYILLKGLAKTGSEKSRAILANAIETRSWLAAAALQGILESEDPYWGAKLFAKVQEFRVYDSKDEKMLTPLLNPELKEEYLDDKQLVAVTLFQAFAMSYKNSKTTEERTVAYLKDLIDIIAILEEYDYVRYFAARAFADVAGFDTPNSSSRWLKYYLQERRMKRLGSDGMPKGANGPQRTSTKGPSFVGMPPVGKRIVLCLDISGSMEDEVTDDVKRVRKERDKPITGEGKGSKKEGKAKKKSHRERINWSKIETKLDLAKADLRITLEDMTEDFYFNIVVYSKASELIDPKTTGFVKASPANKKRFIKLVNDQSTDTLTNIHGALMDAFRITKKGSISNDEDPATDPKALLNGANTVFFLTDGFGSWSDDSIDKVRDKRRKNSTNPAIGDGSYVYGEDILIDFIRLNKFRKCIVNTVGIGIHDDALMGAMAHESGGTYIDLSGKKRTWKPKKK